MRYLLISFLLITALSGIAFASENKYGADLLQQMTVAESDGMGESFTTHSTGSRALNNNPAGLAYTQKSEFLISTHTLPAITAFIMKENQDGQWEDYGRYDIEPVDMALVSYVLPLGKFGSLGLGLVLGYSGRFIRVNEDGKAINGFPRDDLALTMGYSINIFRGFSLGFDIKSIRSKIPVKDGSSIGRTYASNIGFMHQIGKRVRVGAVLQNMGGSLSFDEPDIPNELRRRFMIGATYTLKDSGKSIIALSGDVNPPFDNGLRYNLGTELIYADVIALRIGYMRNTETYYENLVNLHDNMVTNDKRVWIRKGLTIGAGVKIGRFEVNAAKTPIREPILESDEKLRLKDHESIVSLSLTTKF
jgi:hypothetical protein